ncbi:MAG: class I SAM-dependent methyltransferase [Candidatus Methylomirabilales bacterium]
MKKAKPEKAVQRQFGRQASCYAVSRPHATGSSLEVMVDWARPAPTDRVLDVATGTGFTAFTFAGAASEVVATDLTMNMLCEARRLAADRGVRNIRFLQTAAEALPFRNGSFHIATCRIAPHHFASVPAFLREIHRILGPAGRLVLTDSSSPEEPDIYAWHQQMERIRDNSHLRNYTPSEWQRLVAEAGFVLEEFTTAHRSELVFSDWMRTAGSPPEVVAELRRRFVEASPAIRDAFRIREVEGDFHFSWMLVILLARPT